MAGLLIVWQAFIYIIQCRFHDGWAGRLGKVWKLASGQPSEGCVENVTAVASRNIRGRELVLGK